MEQTDNSVNFYEEKRAARIERMRSRASRKAAFAAENDLSLYGEARSGIPLGQPILVGHHSERRHRRHLERIEAKVRKGFAAGEEAERLLERAEAAENRRAIDSDNPQAQELLAAKIKRLEEHQESMKAENKRAPHTFPRWQLSNNGAEIRRLKKRLAVQEIIADASGFGQITITKDADKHLDITAEICNGQIQVEFPWKPNEATRLVLKRSPLALKWSSYSGRWVRKHTATTASQYFRQELIKALEMAQPE